jgi:IS5 family transposase
MTCEHLGSPAVLAIAAKRNLIKRIQDPKLRDLHEHIEHIKASIRALVEHPFRGLAKNGAQVKTLFALANLWMARKRLLATTG